MQLLQSLWLALLQLKILPFLSSAFKPSSELAMLRSRKMYRLMAKPTTYKSARKSTSDFSLTHHQGQAVLYSMASVRWATFQVSSTRSQASDAVWVGLFLPLLPLQTMEVPPVNLYESRQASALMARSSVTYQSMDPSSA
jgi:hypothetical protein